MDSYKKGEKKDKGWACDLVPKPLIIARYFAKEQKAIDALETKLAAVSAELEELAEEHGGEEGVLKDVSSKSDAEEAYTQAILPIWNEEDKQTCGQYNALVESAAEGAVRLKELGDQHDLSALKTSKGKLTLKAIKTRLEKLKQGSEATTLTAYIDADKQQKTDTKQANGMLVEAESAIVARLSEEPLPENYSDLQVVVRYLSLLASQSELKAKLKSAVEALDKLAYDKYPQLSIDEIKSLVVDDKWMPTLAATVQGELDRVSQTLTGRIRQLAERYETPLPELEENLTLLADCVDAHLKKMGAVYK